MRRSTSIAILCAVFASITLLDSAKAPAADKLSDILREAKWDGLIGTWVDAETMGDRVKTSYAWKVEDRVIEVTSKLGELKTVALMGVNGKTGEVFHMGADSAGNSSLGKWTVADNGDAILEIAYTTGSGQEGTASIRYHKEDEDAVMLTVEMDEPIKMKLVRAKN